MSSGWAASLVCVCVCVFTACPSIQPQNLTLATDIIMTHIVADFYPTTALTSGLQLPTLNAGVNVSVLVNATGGIAIQSPGATADVIQGDLLVGNSVGQVST